MWNLSCEWFCFVGFTLTLMLLDPESAECLFLLIMWIKCNNKRQILQVLREDGYTFLDDGQFLLSWYLCFYVGSGLSSREILRKFLTWAEPKKKDGGFPVSSAQHTGKVFLKTNRTDGKRMFLRSGFSGSQPTGYQQPQTGDPKPENNFGSRKFVSSVLFHVEKISLCSTVKLFFKSDQK